MHFWKFVFLLFGGFSNGCYTYSVLHVHKLHLSSVDVNAVPLWMMLTVLTAACKTEGYPSSKFKVVSGAFHSFSITKGQNCSFLYLIPLSAISFPEKMQSWGNFFPSVRDLLLQQSHSWLRYKSVKKHLCYQQNNFLDQFFFFLYFYKWKHLGR